MKNFCLEILKVNNIGNQILTHENTVSGSCIKIENGPLPEKI